MDTLPDIKDIKKKFPMAKYEPTPDCGGCNGRGTIPRGAKDYPCPCIYFGERTPFVKKVLGDTLKKIIDEPM